MKSSSLVFRFMDTFLILNILKKQAYKEVIVKKLLFFHLISNDDENNIFNLQV